jgi:F0F1-type ATP synthase delta subunit
MNVRDQHQLAVRYATAFLNYIHEPLSIAACEAAASAIIYYKRAPELLFFLQLSLFSYEDKQKALAQVREWYNAPALLEPLDTLLLSHHRIFLLPSVYAQLIAQSHQRAGRIVCTVTTASPLTESYQKKCYQIIEQCSLQTPLIKWSVDPSLIAGIKMQTAEWLWEDSLDDHLKALAAQLLV